MGQFSKAFLQLLAWNSYLTKRIEKILVYEKKKDRDLLKNFAVRNFSFDLVFNFFFQGKISSSWHWQLSLANKTCLNIRLMKSHSPNLHQFHLFSEMTGKLIFP